MKFLESDLEEIIYTTSSEELRKRGLQVYGKRFRQLRIGNYGIADLVTFERLCIEVIDKKGKSLATQCPCVITVYELKKDKIGISAFLQAVGYARGIHSYLKERRVNFEFKINIVLIGSKIDERSNYVYLSDLLSQNGDNGLTLKNYTYEYNFDGIKFKVKKDYKLIHEGFNLDCPF